MSFALQRSRRANAGNRMQALIDKEIDMEELFDDESDDEEFTDEGEAPDTLDSDFDMEASEGEEEHARQAAAEEKQIQRQEREARRGPSKAAPVAAGKIKKPAAPKPKKTPKRTESSTRTAPEAAPPAEFSGSRQSLRAQTMLNRMAVQAQLRQEKERKAQQPKRAKRVVERLTQEELLAEAAVTEEENRASLEQWQRLEEERQSKAKVKVKKQIEGPVVRFHSFTEGSERPKERRMILISDDAHGKNTATEMNDIDAAMEAPFHSNRTGEMQARNLITFFTNGLPPLDKSDDHPHPTKQIDTAGLSDQQLDQLDLIPSLAVWAHRPPRPVQPILCPLTGKPAKYRDPVTKIPYHDVHAYATLKDLTRNKYTWSPAHGVYTHHQETDANGAHGVPANWATLIRNGPTPATPPEDTIMTEADKESPKHAIDAPKPKPKRGTRKVKA
ncbi:YL1 nuclear protein-domain-containing protein [Gongronella butleri]|nr:YL1 nuclear protein-domain-containing protein [Gongronella butleri]